MQEHSQPFAALHAPIADLTWEVQATLPDATQETGRIPLDFRGPIEILGLYPSISVPTLVGGGLAIPTVDDLLCLIDINNQDRLTNRLEQASAAGPGSTVVTLGALGVQVPRLFCRRIEDPRPTINVQFRWKRTVGAARFEAVIIGLAFYVRYL